MALVVGCIAYQRLYPHHWGVFALLFLVPDISLLGYLRPANKTSAAFYNLVHSYVLPLGLGLLPGSGVECWVANSHSYGYRTSVSTGAWGTD